MSGEPDPEDPHFVHNETRQFADQMKKVVQKNFSRHGTNEQQIVGSIKQFGVSEQSKLMMARERAAAEMAIEQKVYGVWRNENARHEVNRDFCSRIGALHRCFCGHPLSAHNGGIVGKDRRGFPEAPRCGNCPCEGFRYIPNEPEEVGEHWLSRRPGFVPGAWEAKCRCGHGSSSHDQSARRGGGCNACRNCYGFDGHFLCGSCDGKFTDHVTVFETEAERRAAGRPVREDFIPLKGLDWEVQEIVFGDRLGSQQVHGMGHAIRGVTAGMAGKGAMCIALGGGDDGEGNGAYGGGGGVTALPPQQRQRQIAGGPSQSALSANRTSRPLHPSASSSNGGGIASSSQQQRLGGGGHASFGDEGQQQRAVGVGGRPPSASIPSRRSTNTASESSASLSEGLGGGGIPDHCSGCGTIFRTATSKFCSNCGSPRR